MRKHRRRRRGALLILVSVLAAGTWWALSLSPKAAFATCTSSTGGLTYSLTPEQAANATTIAAEARRQGLSHHAVSVGIAAALQESHLRNLHYGDRDSLGLFQQRPSQGWGAPADLVRPSYAAAAFFRGLQKVHGWEHLEIYQAAQRVQRSADPAAYALWDRESRTMAQGITGEAPGSFSCKYSAIPKAGQATRQALTSAAVSSLGSRALAAGVDGSYGWLVATWLVSRAPTYSLSEVTFAGWTWTPAGKGWVHTAGSASGSRVTYSLKS